MILCIQHPNGHTRTLLELINTFSKMVGYNMKISAFLDTNDTLRKKPGNDPVPRSLGSKIPWNKLNQGSERSVKIK